MTKEEAILFVQEGASKNMLANGHVTPFAFGFNCERISENGILTLWTDKEVSDNDFNDGDVRRQLYRRAYYRAVGVGIKSVAFVAEAWKREMRKNVVAEEMFKDVEWVRRNMQNPAYFKSSEIINIVFDWEGEVGYYQADVKRVDPDDDGSEVIEVLPFTKLDGFDFAESMFGDARKEAATLFEKIAEASGESYEKILVALEELGRV